ncbi:MAG: hypothetical protein QOK38_3878, partial [Acidobacteriaceae bacterium]|nr:hypothetical protein [Acidobacteriaceae bacterium]
EKKIGEDSRATGHGSVSFELRPVEHLCQPATACDVRNLRSCCLSHHALEVLSR